MISEDFGGDLRYAETYGYSTVLSPFTRVSVARFFCILEILFMFGTFE